MSLRLLARAVHATILLALLSTVCIADTTSTNATTSRPPNIVVILADDLGWKDTGYAGTDFYETPNIDRLAKEGMVFTNAYACGANCAPSRACLMSGQYTPRHGVFAVDSTLRGPVNLMRLVPIPNKSGLAQAEVTIADMLKAQGYATGIFGKWHLGGKDGAPPSAQGFDFVMDPAGRDEGSATTGSAKVRGARKANKAAANTGAATQKPPAQSGRPGARGTADPKGIFAITKSAGEFMETNKDRPFFAYVAHHAIHTPLQARPETIARFKAKTPGKQHTDAIYAACTYDFDEGVGLLLNKIKQLGLESNTLLIFTSDNGGTPASPQEPLRGNKGCYYEGGIREPFIARWPGVIKPLTTSDVPIVNVDLFPTFAAAAGAQVPKDKILDGENLLPLFRGGKSLERKAVFWHFPGYLNNPVIRGRDPVFRTRPVSVIRKGDWKLLLYHEEWVLDGGAANVPGNHAVELYNLTKDEGERQDLAASEPTKRDELLRDLQRWMKSVNAPIPTKPNPDYDPNAKPETLPPDSQSKD